MTMRSWLVPVLLLPAACSGASRRAPATPAAMEQKAPAGDVVALFNGRDLAGWDAYLGSPDHKPPFLGFGNDPKGVFSVVEVDGTPVIRVSGEIFGALTTKEE